MGEVPSPSSSTMPGPGRAWVTPGPGGGPWSATAHSFVQHQLSHAVNFWRQGRPAVFHLQSRSDGQAVLNLTFQLPSPSEIIPPPSPYSTTPLPTSIPRRPGAPTPLPKRPIVPLFPPGEVPTKAVLQTADVMINVLSEIRQSRSFIPEDYSRQHTGMAESRMGEEEA